MEKKENSNESMPLKLNYSENSEECTKMQQIGCEKPEQSHTFIIAAAAAAIVSRVEQFQVATL